MISKIFNKWNELLYVLLIVAIAIVFMVIYFSTGKSASESMYDGIEMSVLKKDWRVYGTSKEDGTVVFIPQTFDVPVGKTVSIKRICDSLEDGMALCFRTEHTSVRVIVNNVEIYSFGWEDIPLGKSPGSKWHVIPMQSENMGKIMEIQFSCAYDKYSGVTPEILYGTEADANLYVQNKTVSSYIANYVPLVLGAILLLAFVMVRKLAKIKQLVYLGMYLIFNALWGMAESGYFQFMQGNDFAMHFFKSIMFALVPVAMVVALKEVGIVKKNYGVVFGVVYLSAIAIVVMQLLEIRDFYETTILVHISLIIACAVIFFDNYAEHVETQAKHFKQVFMAFAVLATAIVVDLADFYTFGYSQPGTFLRFGSIIFVTILGSWAITQAMDIYREGTKKEIFANMAYTDTLTGLYNRRSFDDDLKEIEMCRTKVIVVMIDLNNLKTINDKLGHQSGDNAIKAISRRLKRFTEKYGEKCYRTGGDEFCVICKKMNVNDIISTCDGINEELFASREVPGAILSMAYGYKSYDPYMYDTIEQVVMKADEMMYEKKQKMKAEMAAKAAK